MSLNQRVEQFIINKLKTSDNLNKSDLIEDAKKEFHRVTNLEQRIEDFLFFIQSLDYNKEKFAPYFNKNSLLKPSGENVDNSDNSIYKGQICFRGKTVKEINEKCDQFIKKQPNSSNYIVIDPIHIRAALLCKPILELMLLKDAFVIFRNIGEYKDDDILRLKLIVDHTDFGLYIYTAQDGENLEPIFTNIGTSPKTIDINLLENSSSFSTPSKSRTPQMFIHSTPSGKRKSIDSSKHPYKLRSSEKLNNNNGLGNQQTNVHLEKLNAAKKCLVNDAVNKEGVSPGDKNSDESVGKKKHPFQNRSSSSSDIKEYYARNKEKRGEKVKNDVELMKLIFPKEFGNVDWNNEGNMWIGSVTIGDKVFKGKDISKKKTLQTISKEAKEYFDDN